MHTLAVVIGALLALNCAFWLFYMARMSLRIQRSLHDVGMTMGEFWEEMPWSAHLVQIAHAAGVALGAFLIWWGLT